MIINIDVVDFYKILESDGLVCSIIFDSLFILFFLVILFGYVRVMLIRVFIVFCCNRCILDLRIWIKGLIVSCVNGFFCRCFLKSRWDRSLVVNCCIVGDVEFSSGISGLIIWCGESV